MKFYFINFFLSHLENITQTRNPATRIENDLKHLKTLKTEPSPSIETASAAATTSSTAEKRSELISDSTETTANHEEAVNKCDNLLEDPPENDDIRKRRLQHFQTSQ